MVTGLYLARGSTQWFRPNTPGREWAGSVAFHLVPKSCEYGRVKSSPWMWPVERSFCLERARPSPAKSPIISRCQRSHNGPWPALRDDGRLSEGEGNNFLSPMAGSLSSGTTVMVDSHELRLLFQPRSSINSCPALVAASGVGVPFCPESATGPMAGAAETSVHVS